MPSRLLILLLGQRVHRLPPARPPNRRFLGRHGPLRNVSPPIVLHADNP